MNILAELRKEAGMTQLALSQKLNVDRSTVAKWESGEVMPTADKLPRIAKVLHCKIDDLFKEA